MQKVYVTLSLSLYIFFRRLPSLEVGPILFPSPSFHSPLLLSGVYLMNPSVLDRIELTPTSLKTEVFPNIVSDRKLYAMVFPQEGF